MTRGCQRNRLGEGGPAGLGQGAGRIVPRHQVGEHEPPGPGPGRVLRRLPRGQVQVRRKPNVSTGWLTCAAVTRNGPICWVPGTRVTKSKASVMPGGSSRPYDRAIRDAAPPGEYTGIRGRGPSGWKVRATQEEHRS